MSLATLGQLRQEPIPKGQGHGRGGVDGEKIAFGIGERGGGERVKRSCGQMIGGEKCARQGDALTLRGQFECEAKAVDIEGWGEGMTMTCCLAPMLPTH